MSESNSYVANRSTQESRVTTKQICLIGYVSSCLGTALRGSSWRQTVDSKLVRKESNYLIKKQYFFFVLTECVQGVCVGQTPRCRDEIVDNTPHMLMVHHVQDCPLSCLNSEVLPLAGSDLSVFNGRGKQWGVFFSFFFFVSGIR